MNSNFRIEMPGSKAIRIKVKTHTIPPYPELGESQDKKMYRAYCGDKRSAGGSTPQEATLRLLISLFRRNWLRKL